MKKSSLLLTSTLCAGILVASAPSMAFATQTDAAIGSSAVSPAADPDRPAPVAFSLASPSGTHAQILIKGIPGAQVDITRDGVAGSLTKHLTSRGEITVTYPVMKGATARFSATQTIFDMDAASTPHTSDPSSFEVASNVTDLAAPTIVSVFEIDYDTVPVKIEGRPGAEITVTNSRGETALKSTVTIGETGVRTVPVSLRSASGTTTGRFTVTQSLGGVVSQATAFHKDDQVAFDTGDLVQPAIDVDVTAGYAHVVATAAGANDSVMLKLKGLDGNTIANAPFSSEGRAETWFRAPVGEGIYIATTTTLVDLVQYESAATRVIINEGMSSPVPDAPLVEAVTAAGTRTIVSVSGRPGATLRISDAAGKPVVVKAIGRSATSTQVVVPTATRTADSYTITQTADSVTSDPATISLDTK